MLSHNSSDLDIQSYKWEWSVKNLIFDDNLHGGMLNQFDISLQKPPYPTFMHLYNTFLYICLAHTHTLLSY